MLVYDATPLIYLATVERLDLLSLIDHGQLVPETVHEEVVTAGLEAGHADARRVERAVEDGIVEVSEAPDTDLATRLQANDRLSAADVSVLALADHRGATAVMDEQYGRDVADTEGIETRGTAFLVLSLLRDGEIDAGEARKTIDMMVETGWYCSPAVYTTIVERIDEVSG